jgi:hypothetical protein
MLQTQLRLQGTGELQRAFAGADLRKPQPDLVSNGGSTVMDEGKGHCQKGMWGLEDPCA